MWQVSLQVNLAKGIIIIIIIIIIKGKAIPLQALTCP